MRKHLSVVVLLFKSARRRSKATLSQKSHQTRPTQFTHNAYTHAKTMEKKKKKKKLTVSLNLFRARQRRTKQSFKMSESASTKKRQLSKDDKDESAVAAEVPAATESKSRDADTKFVHSLIEEMNGALDGTLDASLVGPFFFLLFAKYREIKKF